MHETDEYKVSGSYEELGRLVGCETNTVARCVIELGRTKTADVTNSHGEVTIISRRRLRELNVKEGNTLRKRKERERRNVTDESQDRVKSKKIEKEIREEKTQEKECASVSNSHLETILSGLRTRLNVNILRDESGWVDSAAWAEGNGFSAEQFLECFDLMAKQKWRKGRIAPGNVGDNLPTLDKLRLEITEQENGTGKQNNKRSDLDAIAESVEFYRNYPN